MPPGHGPQPQRPRRFADVKAAADVLLKGRQPGHLGSGAAAARAWDPAAAAAAAAAHGRPPPRHHTAALWAGACLACGLAFGYGAYWQRRYAHAAAEAAEGRMSSPVPQRRKLLAALLADQQQQQRRLHQAAVGAGAAAAASGLPERGRGPEGSAG